MLTPQSVRQPVGLRGARRSGGLPTHVLVVDDHPAVRGGVRHLLAEQPDLETIAESGQADVATGELARWADVAVVDYHLGGRDGLWLTLEVRRHPRPPRVLIYSAFADHALAIAAIIAGADGLLSKHALDQELCTAIRQLARGRRHFPAIPVALQAALRARLTPSDRPLFDRLMAGAGADEAADALALTRGELELRRAAMLHVLAPGTPSSALPAGAHGPLDYDRRRRAVKDG